MFADVKVTEKQHEKDLRTNIKLLAAVEKQAEKAVQWVDKWVSTRVGKVRTGVGAVLLCGRRAVVGGNNPCLVVYFATMGYSACGWSLHMCKAFSMLVLGHDISFSMQELEKLEAQFRVKKDALDVKRRALLEIELKKRGLLA